MPSASGMMLVLTMRDAMLCRACHFYGIKPPVGFPQLSDAEKAELDAMSEEQLKASFKAAGQVFSLGSSAYRGVSWWKQKQKWKASITIDGIQKYLGCSDSEEEAAHAYDQAVLARDGMCANLP